MASADSGRRIVSRELCAALCVMVVVASRANAAFDSGASGASSALLKDAFRAGHHGRYTKAIAFDTKAIAASPNYGDAYFDRASHYIEAGRYAEAATDLDRVAAMRPNSVGVALDRVRMALYQGDSVGALATIKLMIAHPLTSTERAVGDVSAYSGSNSEQVVITNHGVAIIYTYASIAAGLQHLDDAALAYMDNMMAIDQEHPEYALADYCDVAGRAGWLEMAELTCQQSIDRNSHDIGQYDSLGFVYLRMKAWDKAITAYNKSIDSRSDLTVSLYGRGIAKRAKGDIAGGNADIAAATQDEPDIANIMKRIGAPPA